MKVPFYKFHGNGNDFIVIDGMTESVILTKNQVQHLCHRRFGIGADGLIQIIPSENYAFIMKYFNSDGNESTMCGNGGRCISAFAFMRGYVESKFSFEAIDGIHQAVVEGEIIKNVQWFVSLQMQDVVSFEAEGHDLFLDTGSPHLVRFVEEVDHLDVFVEGRKLRNATRPETGGVNVNFVQLLDDHLFVRTYERGVEEETLSCGTGVTASAIAAGLKFNRNDWNIETLGGKFKVDFEIENKVIREVWLRGPAEMICWGETIVR